MPLMLFDNALTLKTNLAQGFRPELVQSIDDHRSRIVRLPPKRGLTMQARPIKVLLIEDDARQAYLLRQGLAEYVEERRYAINHVDRIAQVSESARDTRFDVVLLDLSPSEEEGMASLARARATIPDVPIVALTELDKRNLGVKAVQNGAQDYLVKGKANPETVARAIDYAIERHRLIAELERNRGRQSEAEDQFLSHISREFHPPLTVIFQFITILLDGLAGDLNPEQRDYLEVALKNAHELAEMISDLLELARADAGKLAVEPRRVSLGGLVRQTLKTFERNATEKRITLSLQDLSALPAAYADPDRVRQVLYNLIDNAIKFTPAKGKVVVEGHVSWEDPSYVCVTVSDTGCGITPEARAKIFDRLYQEHHSGESGKGLGLGLHLCKQWLALQGGQISVESELGRGSAFRVTLPVANPSTDGAAAMLGKGPNSNGKPNDMAEARR
jgi:signal transduction histidine kinase